MNRSAHRTALWLVVGVFAVSRLAFYAAGVRFDAHDLYSDWQVLDVFLLEHDLWRSLWHLHGQPPMLNLLIGLAVKAVGPDGAATVVWVVWMALALAAYLAMFGLFRRFGVGPWGSLALTALFMVGPPAILYENWLLYTGPVAWLLLLAAYALVRYLERETIGLALAFFAVLAVVVLTRSAYHLVWLAAAVAGVLVVRPRLWRRTVLAAVIPLALAAGLYAKNYAQFGAFASSSWLGLSLSKLAVAHVPEPVRQDLVTRGVLSPLALAPSFARPQEYEALIGPAPTTGVPALDFRRKFSGFLNYNHAIYPQASQILLHDSIAALVHFPKAMAWALMKSVYYFTLAPSDYAFLDANRARIAGWETAFDLVFYGKVPRPVAAAVAGPMPPGSAAAWAQRISPFAVAALGLVAAGGLVLFVSLARRRFRGSPAEVALIFMWGTVLYLAVVCVSVEVFENNRMRFEIEPFLFIGAVVVLARLFGRRLPA